MRIAFLQYGDYRDAFRRLAETGEEVYHAQRYSVGAVADLAAAGHEVAVIAVAQQASYDEALAPRLRAVGDDVAPGARDRWRRLEGLLSALAPDKLVVRHPDRRAIAWALDRGIDVLPCFADSFGLRHGLRGLIDLWRRRRLVATLNHPGVRHVGNHNLAASRDLARIGVRAAKIVPWDWPRAPTPDAFAPKPGLRPAPDRPLRFVFIGAITEAKGAGDALRALARLPAATPCTLDLVGGGDLEGMRALAGSLGLAERARFLGRVPFGAVIDTLRGYDAQIVCTRRDYAEGMPGVIYQGLTARLPLVVSDHPMFTAYLRHGRDALVARAGDPDALAAAMARLAGDPALQAVLSVGSADAFARILHPVRWGEVVGRWIADGPEDRAWLDTHALPRW